MTIYYSLEDALFTICYSLGDAKVQKKSVHCFNITNELTAQQTKNLENY